MNRATLEIGETSVVVPYELSDDGKGILKVVDVRFLRDALSVYSGSSVLLNLEPGSQVPIHISSIRIDSRTGHHIGIVYFHVRSTGGE